LNRSIERIELFSLVLRRRAQNEYESPTEIKRIEQTKRRI